MVDTKLARLTKAETILQLCLYAELIEHIQGVLPEKIGVVTPLTLNMSKSQPDVEPEWYRTNDYMANFHHVKTRLVSAIESVPATCPDPV